MFNDPYNPYWSGGAGFGQGRRARSGRGGYPAGPYAFGGYAGGGRGRGHRARRGRGAAFATGPYGGPSYGPGPRGMLAAGGLGFAAGALGAGQMPGALPGAGMRRGGPVRFALLGILRSDGARNGAQLMQTLTERSLGRWYPNPALIYATLQQLEDEGLIQAANVESGTGRTFELTDAGTKYLEQISSQPFPWAPVNEGFASLRQAVLATVAAARQVGLTGTAEGSTKAAELLEQARQGIYRLLSTDADGDARPDAESDTE
jgi:DNA-binding PadR family transcriptional regulator